MRVFVTGASGFVGSAVVQNLLAAGHAVVGLARSDAAAAAIAAAGAEVHRGALDDADSLRRGAAASEGVIHTAFVHDFANIAASGVTDHRAIDTIGEALAGSQRPFVVTSAIGMLPSGRLGTEADAPAPSSAGGHRVASEVAALALAARGVRVSVVRLPPSVHGDGDHGFVPALIGMARQAGVSPYIAEGQNRWAAVHRLDAAELYRRALEGAPAGQVLHAIGDEGVATREIAEVIGRRLGVPVVSRSGDAAAAHFTWLVAFFANDNPASAAKTRELLGWQPRELGLIADLERGSYF